MNIDLNLLKFQKEILNATIVSQPNLSKEQLDAFDGIVNLLDAIQDKLENEKNFQLAIYETPKILITVEGGIVQNVSSNCELKYVIVDYDKHSDEPVSVSGPLEPDTTIKPGEKFHIEFLRGELSATEKKAKRELKKLDF